MGLFCKEILILRATFKTVKDCIKKAKQLLKQSSTEHITMLEPRFQTINSTIFQK